VALAHLVIRDLFGCTLPAALQTYELIREREYFEPVPSAGELRPGDLLWFGPTRPPIMLEEFTPRFDGDDITNMSEFPVKHVAICTDGADEGDPVLLHASREEGTPVLWPLRRFSGHDRYRRIYAIRRLRSSWVKSSAGLAAGPHHHAACRPCGGGTGRCSGFILPGRSSRGSRTRG
jgi:hypothetical protein